MELLLSTHMDTVTTLIYQLACFLQFQRDIKVTNTPEPIPGGNPAIASYFLGNGMAIMGSGFARQGWNLDSAVTTNVELVGAFKTAFPTTKKVLAWGSSLGGIITQTLAEKYPTLVDAVAPMCMADNIAPELTAAGDVLWGIQDIL